MAEPKKPTALEQSLAQALERIDKLEQAFCKVATLTGNGNQLSEFGLKRWVPGKKDISKSRG